MNENTKKPCRVPETIGLALSGGGYRAAAFHLGALSYLKRTGLLPAVRMISTVSGGTFTGAAFALSLAEGRAFEEFFRGLYRDLKSVDLIGRGLDRLGGAPPKLPSARHDLIVSMAQVYAETFFRGPDGEPYRFGKVLDSETQLTEVVFNATEFRHGIAFRFQKSVRGRIGNGYLSIDRQDAKEIRIADIVAASSCFPGGFEPLAFPDDFFWPGDKVPVSVDAVVRKSPYTGPVGLMDGGVYDNQGTESLLLADERNEQELDMFVISDVDQESNDFYPFPEGGTTGGLTIGTVNLLSRLLGLACVLTVVLVGFDAWDKLSGDGFTFWDPFRYLIPLFLAGATAVALWWGRKTIRSGFNRIPNVGRAAWEDIRRLRLGQVSEMALLRITSLATMASAIFMNRVRSLGYQTIYRDKSFEGKRVSNLIYHLRPGSRFFFAKRKPDIPKPGSELQRVVEVAATMPTTLWFNKDYEQPSLVATGQATMCYNLMKFFFRNCGKDPQAYPPEVKALWDGLLSDWIRLVEHPYALLEELLPGEALPRP